MQEVGLGQELD